MFFRLPLTRQLDKLLGAAVNGGLAFVIVYVVLIGLAGAGTVLDPLTQARSLQPSQVAAMQMLLAANPQAAGFVPASSQLAPLVLTYGARLPIIGRHVTLPKA
jgi:SNF family Na+-dependent transporter